LIFGKFIQLQLYFDTFFFFFSRMSVLKGDIVSA